LGIETKKAKRGNSTKPEFPNEGRERISLTVEGKEKTRRAWANETQEKARDTGRVC